MVITCVYGSLVAKFPIDTGRKLKVQKTFRRRPGHLFEFYLEPIKEAAHQMCS